MDLCFGRSDRQRLKAAMSEAGNIRGFRRVQAVLWVAEGRSVAEAAKLGRASLRSVYYWCETYLRTHSAHALLVEKPRSGRPKSPAACISAPELEAIMKKSPLAFGYQSTGWTLALLATHLQRQFGGKRPGRSTLRERLHALGWRWKRPRFVFSHPDPEKAQKKESHSQGAPPCVLAGTRLCHG